jgi:hypothetical protein
VFKPTSPMSVGSWLLIATGGCAATATAHEVFGLFGPLGRAARGLAALFGLPLATYTAALVSNTAVPVWHEGRRELPFVFAGSAAASAGAAAALVTPPDDARPARRLILVGALVEIVGTELMERRLGELAEPYKQGKAGRYARLAKVLTAGGSALVALRGRKRRAAVAGRAAVLAGSVFERWSVFAAGFQSAADPRYTVGPQRARVSSATEAVASSHGSDG